MADRRVLLLAAGVIAAEMGTAALVIEVAGLEVSSFMNLLLGGGMGVVGIAVAEWAAERYDLSQ